MDNIDFLFVGGIIPKENEDEVIKKSKYGIQLAANNFQWSLIRGFDSNLSKPITILNSMFVGSYPKNYDDLIIHSRKFSHAPDAQDFNLGFFNLTIIKQILRPFGENKFLKHWAQCNKDINKKVVFIYSLNARFVRIAKILKESNPAIRIYISVNDLPEFTMLGGKGENLIFRIWKQLNKKWVNKGLKYLDGYMVVAEQIVNHLCIQNKPHVVIEALVDVDGEWQIDLAPYKKDNLHRVVYTGGLNEKYGILNLVEAFRKIESNQYRLVICGDGAVKDKIIEASKADARIKYFGVLAPKEVFKIQQAASVLVNPRQNIGDFTKYSFPIKTIEYLLAGAPVIAYKLDAIPPEYDNHLIYVNDNSIEGLKNAIIKICSLPEEKRLSIGQDNRKFVIETKNHRIQTERILQMMLQNMM